MSFDRSKIVAVMTGVIALVLGIAYLLLVLVLDSRGEMRPAPTGTVIPTIGVVSLALDVPKLGLRYPRACTLD